MKGVVFNIFEAFVCEGWGEEAYETLLDACPLHTRSGTFIGPETYDDADMVLLVNTACEHFGVTGPNAMRTFGHFMLPELIGKYPSFVESHDNAKSFLQSVEDVIHVEVRKLFKGAVTPSFHYRDPAPDQLVIQYSSPRKMCHLMEGLLEGVGDHFDTIIHQRQTQCMHDGAATCDFNLKFTH